MRIFVALVMLIVSGSAYAFDGLDSLFSALGKEDGARCVQVDFKGSWPRNGAEMGFAMMRGDGKGNTRGTKCIIPDMKIARLDSILDLFDSHNTWGQNEYYRTCYDDGNKVVYSLYFNEQTDSLYIVRAVAEDEPCLPYDWPFRTHYDASDSIQTFVKVPVSNSANEIDFTEALVRLYDEVKYNFIFYNRIAPRWERAYHRNLRAIRDAKDDYEKMRILQRMVALCGDGHTFIYFSRGDIEGTHVSPFTTVKLHDGLYVNSVESTELIAGGMKRGQKIVAVNGESPALWAESELKPYVCSSTPQWTDHRMYDGYYFSMSRRGSPMNLTLENPDGSRIHLPHKVGIPKWDSSLAKSYRNDFKVIDKNIGVLTIPNFQNSEVTEFFDSVYPSICATAALIIDLRGNEGGNSGYADHIARHLIDRPIPTGNWRTRLYNPAFASWGRKEDIYSSSQDSLTPVGSVAPYLRPVVLLTDRGTFSAAEDFTALLKSAGRITQIGTATGGSTGNGVRPSLTGNGAITANICAKHDVAPDGTEFVGIGLIPDIIVEERAESYFDPSRDDVIEKAVLWLRH